MRLYRFLDVELMKGKRHAGEPVAAVAMMVDGEDATTLTLQNFRPEDTAGEPSNAAGYRGRAMAPSQH